MNNPLIFPFTCSRAHFNHCHKKDDASTSSSHFTKTEPKYPGYLTSFGARVCTVAICAKLTLCKSENVLISKSFTMFKSRYVSPSHQKCGLFFSACISTAALHTLGQAKHRADRKQGRCRVSETAVKTPVETHIPNALNARPKTAPKT